MIDAEKKLNIIQSYQSSSDDTGSTPVQIALLTEQIANLTGHLAQNKKDFSTKRGLLRAVGKRRRLLQYLERTDRKQYLDLIKRLGLKK